MFRPKLELLDRELIERIVGEGIELLWDPGVMIYAPQALELLAEAGATVDVESRIARIPADLIHQALHTAPSAFDLYNADGEVAVHYGGDAVHFDPGSAAITILDAETGRQRKPVTADFVTHLKLAEGLEGLDAVSTALVCSDVPRPMADLYRLYLVLKYARKPVVTGAFAVETFTIMKEMLATVVGGEEALAQRPIAVFDVCPSPPLAWSEITCHNLMDCARYRIPAQLVAMPLAGATAPVPLAGALAQHTAENLSGVVIHQLVQPGAPIVYGGSPAILDMRYGTTPMGAIETVMLDCAYTQIGKHLGLPTHAYLGMSDAKIVDGQAGFESGIGTILGALAGVNMISGAGMLAFESCQSHEKLVMDNEIILMARRLLEGIVPMEEVLATALVRQVGHRGNFLATQHTAQWFQQEQLIPSAVVDRASYRGWLDGGEMDIVVRARQRVEEIVAAYPPKELPPEVDRELTAIVTRVAREHGLEALPPLG